MTVVVMMVVTELVTELVTVLKQSVYAHVFEDSLQTGTLTLQGNGYSSTENDLVKEYPKLPKPKIGRLLQFHHHAEDVGPYFNLKKK
ncbi:hypothetical protein GHT06_017120 [Daphnia sinensis]|uniref:Uncharacterized protein n=1 Tax=Daphnia sinensis TaxID=1820382 RepID=A0AAD5PVS7_9CRUS|nr:hypothetical protein GHT06_017120 [Daphnia sinensis]